MREETHLLAVRVCHAKSALRKYPHRTKAVKCKQGFTSCHLVKTIFEQYKYKIGGCLQFRQARNSEVIECDSQLFAISVPAFVWSRDDDLRLVLWYCMCHFSRKQGSGCQCHIYVSSMMIVHTLKRSAGQMSHRHSTYWLWSNSLSCCGYRLCMLPVHNGMSVQMWPYHI